MYLEDKSINSFMYKYNNNSMNEILKLITTAKINSGDPTSICRPKWET